MNRKMLSVAVLLWAAVATLSLFGGESGITGKWKYTQETPRGELSRMIRFVQDGGNLTVITWKKKKAVKVQGTVGDGKVQWSSERLGPKGNVVKTRYVGTVDGDKIDGTVHIGDKITRKWRARRLKKKQSN